MQNDDADREIVALMIDQVFTHGGTTLDCADRIISALRVDELRAERDALKAMLEALTGVKAVEAACDAITKSEIGKPTFVQVKAAIAAAIQATEGEG